VGVSFPQKYKLNFQEFLICQPTTSKTLPFCDQSL